MRVCHILQSYWEDYHPYGLFKPKVVFTIHNLNYGQKKIAEAAHYCQRFTTVSPTYAFETGTCVCVCASVCVRACTRYMRACAGASDPRRCVWTLLTRSDLDIQIYLNTVSRLLPFVLVR